MPSNTPQLVILILLQLCGIAFAERVPDFETEIQPVLAANGCSTGACHGKQGGKNGFQLSLLGFDSEFDHASLTQQSRGRRISVSSPEDSLILRKATASEPHGGGVRFPNGHPHYQLILSWIRAGAPRRAEEPIHLDAIRIEPEEIVLKAKASSQLKVSATFSDGSTRDVTNLTAFSSNESVVASIDKSAVVTAGSIFGEAAIMGRFMDQIATCKVLLPRADTIDPKEYELLPVHNAIDELVWQKLARLNVVPSKTASDEKFLRRVYLDIIGRLPPQETVEEFLASDSPDKYESLVDDVLQHPGYADHWANKWVDLLRPNPYRVGIKAVMSYDNWIRNAFRENRPYDQFVRGVVTAEGSTWHNGASTLFRDRRSPEELTTMVSQLFLGVRLECARCHHHPFEVWGQDDFYSFAAFFAQVGRKGTGLSPPISGGEEIVFTASSGETEHPLTEQKMVPRTLTGEEVDAKNRRVALADWMTQVDNPFFSKVIANRVWADLMGIGIVDPVDDMRATNPPSNPALIDALAAHLRESNYDLKSLIRLIATSYVYRLSSEPNETNVGDYRNYSRKYRERLRAEVLLDAINDITDSTESFDAMPLGSRANQVWSARVPSMFLDTFSRPDLNQDPPCMRIKDSAVVQALHLMNSPELHKKVVRDDGYAAKLAKSELKTDEVVRELYLQVFSRYPSEEELAIGKNWFESSKSKRTATEDLLWSLLNTAEFTFKD